MKLFILGSGTLILLLFILWSSSAAAAQPPALGQFEAQSGIGAPSLPGRAGYDTATQRYEIVAGGTNMWFRRDQFHFLHKAMSGDFILQATAEFAGEGTDPHRKFGWMVRASLEPGAAYVGGAVHGDGLTALQFRRVAGVNTEEIRLPMAGAAVIQLERKGNHYVFSAARFGEPFVSSHVSDLAFGDPVHVGLFACAHRSNVVERVWFRNVRIVRPVREGFVPYRDYIGSHLEILDVRTGARTLLHSSADPFEAPNWTPDGKALIYNTSGAADQLKGRLHRFDLATGRPSLINTDFAIRNNNDHVLSFDGKMIGLSHHSADHDGQSAIYTMPIDGGTPRLITPQAPSYLHGWSPDGRFLVYTGGRNGDYDVYRIPSDGGEEVRLTRTAGLDDGPEYTPDGRYIYFNSTRSGRMQIWRMKPDGADPEQVTNDRWNNWFPHISPDGKLIAFLSYGSDVAPTDHPYYKQVYLRMMPIEGGNPKVIAYVYGGQGTMNVPSWAPDSTRLAFVSNSDLR